MGDYLDAAIRRMLERGTETAGCACGSDDLVAAYLEGMLEKDERCRFEEHASRCPNCLGVIALAMKLAAAPDQAQAAAAKAQTPARMTLFRVSIPLAAAAAAAILVIAVVFHGNHDAGGGPVRMAEVRTTSAVEQDRPLAARPPEVRAPDKVVESVPPGAAPSGKRDMSPAVREPASTLGAGKAVPAESPAVPVPRELPEVARARRQTAEVPAGDAAAIRALLASAPGHGQAAAPAAGQAVPRMLAEQAEPVARSDFRASGKAAIRGRTFQDRGAYWVDDECADMLRAEIAEIKPGTKEYRDIMASYPEIRDLLAGGKSVLLCLNGRIYVLR